VTKCIRAAILQIAEVSPALADHALDHIAKAHPTLGEHLRKTVSTGTTCRYLAVIAAPVGWVGG
jgi:hypothetical protein